VDIVLSNNAGPARLLLNESAPAGWLTVRLFAPVTTGASVTLMRTPNNTKTSRRSHSDSSYGSASDPRVHFGLGNPGTGFEGTIEVRWPDGAREKWTGLQPNRQVDLKKGTGAALSRQ
jgi:enediyne biosynthesis protein E4